MVATQEFASVWTNTGPSSFVPADEEEEEALAEVEADHGIAAQRDAARIWEAALAQVTSPSCHSLCP